MGAEELHAVADQERAQALDLAARFGVNPFAFCLRYEAPWRYLFGASVEGAVGYLERDGVALVWGDPLAAPEDAEALLAEATAELRGSGMRVCLVLVGEGTATSALARGYAALKIGEQPYFELADWRRPRGDPGKHLRWCLNRAVRAGVVVRPYEPRDERGAADVLRSWERGLGRTPAQSFLRASPLTLAAEKRIFIAVADGRIEAIVACTPAAGDGWFLEDLVRRPSAPAGATEVLVVETLDRLAADGAARAWMDIAPLRGSTRQLDGRAQLLFRAAQPAVALFDSRYHFRALTRYVEKFVPSGWSPRYVALNPVWPTLRVIRAVSSLL
ncbi:MAG TPA: phosphatidylglycerol lysyltransferase domain-containing protein [Gaiellaceae bacterium]|nr:phosphatidylglycerol lysyltransferase domain-containing protein [Gaiellaceae bacterium]